MIKKIMRFLRCKPKVMVQKSIIDNYQKRGSLIIGDGTITAGSKLTIRPLMQEKVFITIGKQSVIMGNFVIENDYGSIIIGDRTFIGGGNFISAEGIEIGDDVLISWGCTIMDNNAHSLQWEERKNDVLDWKKGIEENRIGAFKNWNNISSAPIVIEDKAWIGFDVVILKGVTIGEGAVVAARSVVTKDVLAYTVVAGNPATLVKNLKAE